MGSSLDSMIFNLSTLGALMEYAVILFMLKKRVKPVRTIDQGLKNLFPSITSNGDATQPLRSPSCRENNNQVSLNYLVFNQQTFPSSPVPSEFSFKVFTPTFIFC